MPKTLFETLKLLRMGQQESPAQKTVLADNMFVG